jgi:hypothetical protein
MGLITSLDALENPTTTSRTTDLRLVPYRKSSNRNSAYHDSGLREAFPIKFSLNFFSSSYYLYAIPATICEPINIVTWPRDDVRVTFAPGTKFYISP